MQLLVYPYAVKQFDSGRHWRVEIGSEYYDFWPSTGTWMNPRDALQRGVANDFNHFITLVTTHEKRA